MPALPKRNPARRNRSATAATLTATHQVTAPPLPAGRDWDPMTVAWWTDTWASPMAPEYDASDRHGLFILAALVDQFWTAPTKELAAEIRLQRSCFGLSPIDRRRLQWEIERAEDAQDRGRGRRESTTPPAGPVPDPRSLLTVVS